MHQSRRSFVACTAFVAALAARAANAQFGGHQRGSGEMPSSRYRGGDNGKAAGPRPVSDPAAAIERELPSLRIDLRLGPEQIALFDSFERQVRNAAEAGRQRARHVAGLRSDDGGALPTAQVVFSTLADDEAQRSEATRLALERMSELYATFSAEQRKRFDERIVQSLRDPLGTS
ncbi:MAG TPA: Spy/CpxP family protein refolding chaperone [Casimicrobiaceae bacterium]|nr:Spy/CpxP family protein refolding chaperone [Casimicrobiaceae bacterium]